MSVEQYYLSESAFIYPSANANDGGEDNSEQNLKTITDKFAIKSFVVRRIGRWETYFLLTYSASPLGVKVTGGECSINGYYFDLKDMVILTQDQGGKTKLKANTKYNVTLRLYKDGVGNLRGDGTALVYPYDSKELINYGVVLGLYTDKELEDIDGNLTLPLGDFTTDSSGNPSKSDSSYHLNEFRFMFIDSDTIITSTGQKIEDWVNERLEYELDHLDELHHWSPDGAKINSTLVLGDNDVTINLKDRGSFSLWEIEDRTQVASSGQYTSINKKSSNITNFGTYNGTSKLIARSDHDHDGRYVRYSTSDSLLQTISTPITVTGNFKVGSLISLNTNGSASFSNNKVSFSTAGGLTATSAEINGSITATGDITGSRVFNAVWNDYADAVPKFEGCSSPEPGDLVCKVPSINAYTISTYENRKRVVGVCSDTFGHLLGGEGKTIEEILENYIPIAVAGNVMAKVVGKAVAGDLIVPSHLPGVGVKAEEYYKGTVVGKILDDKFTDGVERVLIQVSIC